MITRTFRIRIKNVRTGEIREFHKNSYEDKYSEAWKDAMNYAFDVLLMQDRYWLIDEIKHLT